MSIPDYPFYVKANTDAEREYLRDYLRRRGFTLIGSFYYGYVCNPKVSKFLFGDDSPLDILNDPDYYKDCRVNCPVVRWSPPPEPEVHKELCL